MHIFPSPTLISPNKRSIIDFRQNSLSGKRSVQETRTFYRASCTIQCSSYAGVSDPYNLKVMSGWLYCPPTTASRPDGIW